MYLYAEYGVHRKKFDVPSSVQIFSGTIPFHHISNNYRVTIEIMKGKRPPRPDVAIEGLTDRTWDLVEECWRRNPTERPSAGEIVQALRSEMDGQFTTGPDWDNSFIQEIRCNLEDHIFRPPLL
jgi:hypothetical protein